MYQLFVQVLPNVKCNLLSLLEEEEECYCPSKTIYWSGSTI